MVPIIDGFDELLGSAGYRDAFGSLQQFISELDGSGVMVVSARSSFYDVEFAIRSAEFLSDDVLYSLAPITLNPWGPEEIGKYLNIAWEKRELDVSHIEYMESQTKRIRALLGKPFFASQLLEFLKQGLHETDEIDILDFVIDNYISRETSKIVNRDGKPLLSRAVHEQLLEEIAEGMWLSEATTLGADELRLLARLIAEDQKVADEVAIQFVEKVTSYSGFQTTGHGGDSKFRFEHDVYFDYFLGKSVRRQLEGPITGSFFDRGIIPEEVIDQAIVHGELAASSIPKLVGILDDSVFHGNRRRNVGIIISRCIQLLKEVRDLQIISTMFLNVSFEKCVLDNVAFKNCEFYDVNLKGTQFRNCSAENCTASGIYLSDDTLFEIIGLLPRQGLTSIRTEGDSLEIFSPQRIEAVISRLGALVSSEVHTPVEYSQSARNAVRLLKRVMQVYRRTNLICLDTDDEQMKNIFADPMWPILEEIMLANGIVKQPEQKETSGKKKYFLRLSVSIEDLMRFEEEPILPLSNIGEFWAQVRQL